MTGPTGMAPARPLGAVILAGGQSRRFGSDKTRAVVDGAALLERVVASVRTLTGDDRVEQLLVVGDWAPQGVTLTAEPRRGLGPLAGLAHGLGRMDSNDVLVLAADHPWLQPAVLSLVIRRHRSADEAHSDATVLVGPTGMEPLIGCYRREPAAAAATRLLAQGERRLRTLLDSLRVLRIEESEWRALDPEQLTVRDIDRPSDLGR